MKTGRLEQRSNLVQQTQSGCERKAGDSKERAGTPARLLVGNKENQTEL